MGNMDIYNAVRAVPKEAQKPIDFGKMKGKTDINPMWRIKVLTEQFGACGFGWFPEIKSQRLENLEDGQVACFVDINLYVMIDGKVSMPIPGIGGNMFIKKTKNGLETNDECFKMAYTDALSVACKALGIGADIYWSSDKTKYDAVTDNKKEVKQEISEDKQQAKDKSDIKSKLGEMVMELADNDKAKAKELFKKYTSFVSKEGNKVEGKDTMQGMSDKAIQTTYGKVKIDWLKLKEESANNAK